MDLSFFIFYSLNNFFVMMFMYIYTLNSECILIRMVFNRSIAPSLLEFVSNIDIIYLNFISDHICKTSLFLNPH